MDKQMELNFKKCKVLGVDRYNSHNGYAVNKEAMTGLENEGNRN